MSAASFELRWVGDSWKDRFRAVAEPVVEDAFRISVETLDGLGICLEGLKTINMRRLVSGEKRRGVGQCNSPSEISLYFVRKDFRARTDDWILHRTAATQIHEFVHAERARFFEWDTSRERVATEGLAYFADTAYQATISDELGDQWDTLGMADDEEWSSLLRCFMNDTSDTSTVPDEVVSNTWDFNQNGNLIGLWAVTRQLSGGRSLPELIRMPADEILEVS